MVSKVKRIIIAGGRDFPINGESIAIALKHMPEFCTLICGEARGADQLNKELAHRYPDRFEVELYPADWYPNGRDNPMDKMAGYTRNADMGNTATHLLAFWDGKSRGTKQMINYARFKGLKIKIIRYTLRPTKKPVQRKGL